MTEQPRQPPGTNPSAVSANFKPLSTRLAAGLALVLLIAAAYSNALHVPLIFDDIASITDNGSIKHLATAFAPALHSGTTAVGRPVLNATLALNYALTGLALPGFHATNILIHILAALTLWGVIRRTLELPLFQGRYDRRAGAMAWTAAALWALHPLQTEAVTYTIQRAESLAGLFYLLTLYAFIRGNEKNAGRVWPWLAWISCLAGMATKETVATAPVIVLLYDRTFLSGTFRASLRNHGRLLAALAGTWLLLGWLVLAHHGRGGSVGFVSGGVTEWDYLCTQSYAVTRYLVLSLCPVSLTFDYGVLVVKDPWSVILCGTLLVGLLAWTGRMLRCQPVAGFFGAWFFVILAPSSSVVPILTQTIAEHRMYLPLAAIMTALVLLCWRIGPRYRTAVFTVLILGAGFATWQRNQVYGTTVSILEDTVAKRPDNFRALNNLGMTYSGLNRIPETINAYTRAITINSHYAESYFNLAQTLLKAGRTSEALPYAVKGLQLVPENPIALSTYGNILVYSGEPAQGLPYLERSVALDPSGYAQQYNLAYALAGAGRDEEAVTHYRQALAISPDKTEARDGLGASLQHLGRLDEAIAQYEAVLKSDAGDSEAHHNLGIALLLKGGSAEGLSHLREAVRLAPDDSKKLQSLVRGLVETGHQDEAITACETLVRLAPTADNYSHLGVLYARSDRLDKARDAFRAALRIDPAQAEASQNLARVNAVLEGGATP